MKVSVNDPRFLSGELKHINSGKITVKDKGMYRYKNIKIEK